MSPNVKPIPFNTNKMAKKAVAKASKVTKSKPNQQSKKPKGKIVKVAELEDVNTTALENVKNAKVSEKAQIKEQKLVDAKKLTKALDELKKFVKRSQNEEGDELKLFDNEDINRVELIFNKTKLFTTKHNFKQKLIPIPGKPQPETKPTIAFFVKDSVIDKELLEKIEESDLKDLISEIIPANELKTTYKQYEKRRELVKKYDLFITDDGLVTTLPKLLGKVFYGTASKIPISIRVAQTFSIESTINQVNKILNSIVYQLPRNNSLVINLGDINLVNESTLNQVIAHFADEELRSVFIKSSTSPALPLYETATAFSEADVDEESKAEPELEKIKVDGVDEDIEIDTYEKGLIELARPEDVPLLLENKIQKTIKKAKTAEKKALKEAKRESKAEAAKPTKAPRTSAKKSDKVTKPAPKKKVTKKA